MKKALLLCAILVLGACASTQTRIEKKDLAVNTRMGQTIFLEPVAPENQIIYIKVRNTSAIRNLNLQENLVARMMANGFKITNNPDEANFMLLANVRNYTARAESSANELSSIGGALVGGVLGSTIGSGNGQTIATTAGALGGSLAGTAIDARTKDVYFTAEVDIQISQRSKDLISYNNYQRKNVAEGTSSSAKFSTKSNWQKYETKLVSTANKVNLTQEEATPAIISDIVNSLSGLF